MAGVVELHVVIAQGADAPVLDASRNGLPQPRDMRGATQGQARASVP